MYIFNKMLLYTSCDVMIHEKSITKQTIHVIMTRALDKYGAHGTAASWYSISVLHWNT
jgi:hypothetical protein